MLNSTPGKNGLFLCQTVLQAKPVHHCIKQATGKNSTSCCQTWLQAKQVYNCLKDTTGKTISHCAKDTTGKTISHWVKGTTRKTISHCVKDWIVRCLPRKLWQRLHPRRLDTQFPKTNFKTRKRPPQAEWIPYPYNVKHHRKADGTHRCQETF